MFYILLYWCYLFLISSAFGTIVLDLIGAKRSHVVIAPILGIFSVTVLGSIYAVFNELSFVFEFGIFIIAVLCIILNRQNLKKYFGSIVTRLKGFSLLFQILITSIVLLAALQSATAPYLIDNESYYLPTIKWLDNFGFVPGLANLHVFLGQISGWHISQSALNLDFVYSEFNDLNGFFLILGNFYVLDKLHDYFAKRELYLLILGLFPMFNILLFQFLSSPSPDLPMYVLSIIIVGEYFESTENQFLENRAIIFILVIFSIFIKVTSILFLVFPVLVFFNSKFHNRKNLLITFLLSILVGLLFMVKNLIVSGYPLYPLSWFGPSNIDWQLPKNLLEYIILSTKSYAFFLTDVEYKNSTQIDLFFHWLSLPKLHGLFNLSMTILLLIFPIIFYFTKYKKTLILIYLISILQMIILWMSSPQYRFYLAFFIIMILILLAHILAKRTKLIKSLIGLSIFLIMIPLFLNLNLNSLTKNKFHLYLNKFSPEYLVTPHPKTKYTEAEYEIFQSENTILYTPVNIDFFWATGDSPLPGLQKQQYDYFKYYFHVIPVKRTENLKDGFYSKKIASDSLELNEHE